MWETDLFLGGCSAELLVFHFLFITLRVKITIISSV